MVDPNELEALKASVRGAIGTADALASLRGTIEGLDSHHDISTELLEELARVAAAHAVASAALRGLLETMMRRRRPAGA